eukprot:4494382-Amphidinium_carterae.1
MKLQRSICYGFDVLHLLGQFHKAVCSQRPHQARFEEVQGHNAVGNASIHLVVFGEGMLRTYKEAVDSTGVLSTLFLRARTFTQQRACVGKWVYDAVTTEGGEGCEDMRTEIRVVQYAAGLWPVGACWIRSCVDVCMFGQRPSSSNDVRWTN